MGVLPRRLFIQADKTAKETKNKTAKETKNKTAKETNND